MNMMILKILFLLSSGAITWAQRERTLTNRRARQRLQQSRDPVVLSTQGSSKNNLYAVTLESERGKFLAADFDENQAFSIHDYSIENDVIGENNSFEQSRSSSSVQSPRQASVRRVSPRRRLSRQRIKTQSNVQRESDELARETRSGQLNHSFNLISKPRSKDAKETYTETYGAKKSSPRTRNRSRSRAINRFQSTTDEITPSKPKTSFSRNRFRNTQSNRISKPSRTSNRATTKKTEAPNSKVLFPRKNLFPKSKVTHVSDNRIKSDLPRTPQRSRERFSESSKTLQRSRSRSSSRNSYNRDIRPTASFNRYSDDSDDYENVNILSGKLEDVETSGHIIVTHQVPTRTEYTIKEGRDTRTLFADVLETSLQIVDVDELTSTVINSKEFVFAHIQSNQPQFGVTEYTIEAIEPTRTSITSERSVEIAGKSSNVIDTSISTIYNVETITARTTETVNPEFGIPSASEDPGHLGALLQNVLLNILGSGLLGNNLGLGAAPITPQTKYITHTRSFLTTVTSTETLVVPVNFRGAKIFQTITDLKTDVVTVSELSIQTMLDYNRKTQEPFLPLAPTLHRAARVVESQPPFINLARPQPILSTSFITRTNTGLTTITTETTSNLVVTLGGREITTAIVEPITKTLKTVSLSTEAVHVPTPQHHHPAPQQLQRLQLVRALLGLK